MPDSFTEKFAAGLASYGDRRCIEFEGRWYSGDDITAYADAIASALDDAGVADGAPVGLVVRNRLPHAAAIIGFLAAGRPVSMIYSFQSPEAIARDIEKLELAAIVADREDWTGEVVVAAKRAGSAGVAISLSPPTVAPVDGLARRDESRHHARSRTRGGAADSLQRYHRAPETAGDQGIRAGTNGLQRDQRRSGAAGRAAGVLVLAVRRHRGVPADRRRIQRQADRRCWSGSLSTTGSTRSRRTRSRASGVQPAVIRMLLDADVPKERPRVAGVPDQRVGSARSRDP